MGRLAVAGRADALHVVGVDLEFGLGVDLGARGQQQVATRLPGLRLLGALVHDGLAIEDGAAAPSGDAAVVLQAARAHRKVIDVQVGVEVAGAVREEESRQFGSCFGRCKACIQVEAGEAGAELRVVHDDRSALCHGGLDALDVEGARAGVEQAVQVQGRIRADLDVHH
jgi:hypothetical protein